MVFETQNEILSDGRDEILSDGHDEDSSEKELACMKSERRRRHMRKAQLKRLRARMCIARKAPEQLAALHTKFVRFESLAHADDWLH